MCLTDKVDRKKATPSAPSTNQIHLTESTLIDLIKYSSYNKNPEVLLVNASCHEVAHILLGSVVGAERVVCGYETLCGDGCCGT